MAKYAALLVLAVASAAFAGVNPSLYYTTADAGSGLVAYNFYIDCDDAKPLSFAVNVAWWGNVISQKQFLGDQINYKTPGYDGVLGYDVETDTWVNPVFTQGNPGNQYAPGGVAVGSQFKVDGVTPIAGFAQGNGTGNQYFTVSVGTPSGSNFGDNTFVGQIVSDAVGGIFQGQIGRDSILYDVSGTFGVPEPATMALLGLGALGLIRRRR